MPTPAHHRRGSNPRPRSRSARAARRRDSTGAAALEFALVVPFLILVLVGMVTTAMTYSDHLSATNAVREGARYGAAADVSSSSWATSVRDRVKQVYFNSGVTVTDAQICVRLVQADGTTGREAIGTDCGSAPSVPSSMATGSCAVLVWMQRPETIDLIIAPSLRFSIGAASVAYYGRAVTPGVGVPTCTAS
jgi:Flp pilus assembly protein TadG